MDAQNSAKIVYESDTMTYLRRSSLGILEAVAVQLPDVFIGEILPKLDLKDTLNLAQVSKAYRDAVWSVGGVQSMEAKLDAHKAHLVKKGMNLSNTRCTVPPHPPMYYAAKHGNLRAVRAFLQSGAWRDKNVLSYLLCDSEACRSSTCHRIYLESTSNLHRRYKFSHAALVKEMIEAGADVNMTVSGSTQDYKFTLRNTQVPRGFTPSNNTPLFIAVQEGHMPCAIELIKAGADVNIARSDGITPLHMAAYNGHEGCVALLIQAGADIHKAANDGTTTPLSLAEYEKHENIAVLLKHFGGAR